MKRNAIRWCTIGILLGGLFAAPQEDEVVRETVRVVNVEVPVRVYHKGTPVDNLTKADFRLYEDRKLQTINTIMLKRKTIKIQEMELNADQKKSYAPRYFVLVFRITHYNDAIKEGIKHVFGKILRESDQLLVFVNNQTAAFNDLSDKTSIREQIHQMLEVESLAARNQMLQYLKSIERELDVTKFNMEMIRGGGVRGPDQPYQDYIKNFFDKYLMVWNDYKKRYLIPDIDKYYNFSRYLKNIDKEKWVINFYQFEVFPKIMISSEAMRKIRTFVAGWQAGENPELIVYARLISRQMAEIEKELSISKDFPSEEVAKIFHNVDTTFHSIFMTTSMATLSQDLEYKRVASDLESSLREITERTGGDLVVSNKLATALDQISEVTDIYYILTYAPTNPDKVGKIRIKLNNRKYKAVYSPNLRMGYLGEYVQAKDITGKPVQIKNLNFADHKLSLSISDFHYAKNQGGKLTIRIQIKNRQGIAVFDEKKNIDASEQEVQLALNIGGIRAGHYDIVVDVVDLFTQKSATEMIHADL